MSSSDLSYASFANLPNLEALYESYKQDPSSVEGSWRHFFEGFELSRKVAAVSEPSKEGVDFRLFHLIDTFRREGHKYTSINPLQAQELSLDLKMFGFKEEERLNQVPSFGLLDKETCSLQELFEALKSAYASKIGVQYMHSENEELKSFIQSQFEPARAPSFSKEERIHILDRLTQAEFFEVFLQTKYTGQKRFSLEGCETLIPVLSSIIEKGVEQGTEEVVIGMSHRGRLNVLANILGKSYGHIFYEFEEGYLPEGSTSGDVKYHKGFMGSFHTSAQKSIPVTLAANSSHLESVDPVIEGITRAKQDLLSEPKSILPIAIHGDAAIAGQGVVYETLQLSSLKGYQTSGSIHIIVNNQIGFTTSPQESRSTPYCTDLAKAFGAPIFHVNAEDPLSCVAVALLSIEIRQRFGIDVFIDLVSYRKYGHNEGDEPAFTQPLEYANIRSKESILTLFWNQLVKEGDLTQEEVETKQKGFKEHLNQVVKEAPSATQTPKSSEIHPIPDRIQTTLPAQKLQELAERFCTFPENFKAHPKIAKLLNERKAALQKGAEEPSIDWGLGEHLAFASLLDQQIPLRLSGQDVGRGTFTHRHALLVDQVTGEPYIPLSHLHDSQGLFSLYNSPLSEYAVMGFEFGYSIANPKTLVIWEAQFGDFVNTAQVPIDQYLASSEQKWNLESGLTLLLPHGYEGQGPEHSSARMERFLQLCAQDNMRLVATALPSQLFHILREQALSSTKKPLILFTPKALLRHPLALSPLSAFTERGFQEVIADEKAKEATHVLLCCGKVYYELLQEKEKRKDTQTALIRLEQLYPFPEQSLKAVLESYPQIKKISWVQEEPQNMGAWEFIHANWQGSLEIHYIGREKSASPAAGSHALHKQELEQLFTKAYESRD